MSLREKIFFDLQQAQRAKNKEVLAVLRLFGSVIYNKEIEKKTKLRKAGVSQENLIEQSQLTDDEITEALSSEIKKRKEAKEIYEKGNRNDLAEKEQEEINILFQYMPEQMSEEEIIGLVEEVIDSLLVDNMCELKEVMKIVSSKVRGRADMRAVSKIVHEKIIPTYK